MKLRYWLFVGDNYYPRGGMDDFHSSYDKLDSAKAVAIAVAPNGNTKWSQIYDSVADEHWNVF